MSSNPYLAVDVGGTFIDFVHFDPAQGSLLVEKIPSSGSLEARFFEGIDLLGTDLSDIRVIVHGSTLVINTVVQESGARVGLITTKGFRDVLELGRGNRPEVYNLFYKPVPPLVPRHLRFGVTERLDHTGEILKPLDENGLRESLLALLNQGVEAIAICFLHAYANPIHERRAAELASELCPKVQICTSSEIVREFREFERTSTTVLNAYTQPRMGNYLRRLERGLTERRYPGAFAVMQSSGGVTSSTTARRVPIRTLQSGPAGGAIGTRRLGEVLGLKNLVAADVGGTTFDVTLIADGSLPERAQACFNGRPVQQATIDIVSVGAGGGSIARLDAEGGLQVGPQSAQAEPGPACFGLGGVEATVTDAQLLLGHLDAMSYLGERMRLDVDAAEHSIRDRVATPLGLSLKEAAAGIVHLANINMAHAIRQVTVERGHDPREFNLVSYGGGGGLFAWALLEELDLRGAIIPPHPATFSAWGLLQTDYREDLSRTFVKAHATTTPAELGERFGELEREARVWSTDQRLDNENVSLILTRYAELRYQGQEHTLRIPVWTSDLSGPALDDLRSRFDAHYDRAYAHALRDHALEFVALRLTASLTGVKPTLARLDPASDPVEEAVKGRRQVSFGTSHRAVECPVFERGRLRAGHLLSGPAIVEEWNSTILVPPSLRVEVDAFGNLLLTVKR